MGLQYWITRLFQVFGGGPSVPCALCHCSIPASDLRKGIAVVIARQKYCKGCVEEITLRSQGSGLTFSADPGSSSTMSFR